MIVCVCASASTAPETVAVVVAKDTVFPKIGTPVQCVLIQTTTVRGHSVGVRMRELLDQVERRRQQDFGRTCTHDDTYSTTTTTTHIQRRRRRRQPFLIVSHIVRPYVRVYCALCSRAHLRTGTGVLGWSTFSFDHHHFASPSTRFAPLMWRSDAI